MKRIDRRPQRRPPVGADARCTGRGSSVCWYRLTLGEPGMLGGVFEFLRHIDRQPRPAGAIGRPIGRRMPGCTGRAVAKAPALRSGQTTLTDFRPPATPPNLPNSVRWPYVDGIHPVNSNRCMPKTPATWMDHRHVRAVGREIAFALRQTLDFPARRRLALGARP